MPRPKHREEIEIKLRVPDIAALRGRLKHLRAREITPRTYESNTLYDTPRHDLRRRGKLIRMRIEQPASSFGKKRPKQNATALLTYKGPSSTSNANKTGRHPRTRSRFKIKDEAEVAITGAGELATILRALGLRLTFRYEKFRTTYALPGLQGRRGRRPGHMLFPTTIKLR
jgi:adenylate cyclase class 2